VSTGKYALSGMMLNEETVQSH